MNTQHDITVSGKPLNPPKPPAKPHMLLWIDTETTGLDPNQCELLEVGMQVTDLKAETRGDSLHLIVHPDNVRNWANHPEMLKAYEMHLANGLMLACAEAPKTGYDYKHTALNIHEFLNDQLSQYTLHPAGTNVDFDLRQLDVHLSRHLEHPITQGLHHRKLDLTSFRLADQAIGGNPYQNHAGTHRVQDCIRRDINDYTDSHPGMECIDLTADTTFCLGNCCKYLWRYHSKGRPLEDLEKARWYLCRVIDYGEKIAWTRQQYDILTALVAHTVGVEARTWAKLKQGYPDSALALIDELIKRERDKQ